MSRSNFKPGEAARIRHSIHSPYSGHTGVIVGVDPADEKGPYLVMFSDGLQFRYTPGEIERADGSGQNGVIESLYRVITETRHGLWRNMLIR